MTITDGFQPLPTTPDFADLDEPHEEPELEYNDLKAPDVGKAPSRGRAPRAGVKVTARTVRTVLAKHAELAAADAQDIELLAATLGMKGNVDDLVAHILSTPRLTLVGVSELEAIVAAARVDPFEAVAVAMSNEPHTKHIWGILTAVGLLDGPRPSKDGDASVAIARAAGKFGPEHAHRLDAVKTLARKGS